MISSSTGDGDLIYNLAVECEQLLDSHSNKRRGQIRDDALASLLADYQQRFATWAAYLGVFARKSQSLDRRLRNAPDLQDLTTRLLDILREALTNFWCRRDAGHTVQQGDQPSRKGQFRDKRSSDSENTARDQRKTPQEDRESMEEVEDVLNRLLRLGVAIRQSSRGSLSARVEKFTYGVNTSLIESLTSRTTEALYPAAHRKLRDRLSKSMVERYSVMLYLKSRKSTLQTRRKAPPASMPTIDENQVDSEKHEIQNDSVGEEKLPSPVVDGIVSTRPIPLKPFAAPSLSDLSTLNTTMLRQALRRTSRAGSHTHKTSSVHLNQASYPREPKKTGDTQTACEWCSEPLTQDKLSGSGWRRHVDNDLKPYVCIWESTQQSCSTYGTFEEWFDHMCSHGRSWHQDMFQLVSWICPICEDGLDVFLDPQLLHDHLQQAHADQFSADQLHLISRQSKTELRRPANECPLCCFRVEGEKAAAQPTKRTGESFRTGTSKSARTALAMQHPPHHATGNNSSDDGHNDGDARFHKELTKTMSRHIASHLQVLMLLSIRIWYLISERADEDAERDGENGSAKSDQVDIHTETSSQHGRLANESSHSASGGSDMEEQDLDLMDGIESQEEVSHLSKTNVDWSAVPLCDEQPVEEDEFLQRVARSRVEHGLNVFADATDPENTLDSDEIAHGPWTTDGETGSLGSSDLGDDEAPATGEQRQRTRRNEVDYQEALSEWREARARLTIYAEIPEEFAKLQHSIHGPEIAPLRASRFPPGARGERQYEEYMHTGRVSNTSRRLDPEDEEDFVREVEVSSRDGDLAKTVATMENLGYSSDAIRFAVRAAYRVPDIAMEYLSKGAPLLWTVRVNCLISPGHVEKLKERLGAFGPTDSIDLVHNTKIQAGYNSYECEGTVSYYVRRDAERAIAEMHGKAFESSTIYIRDVEGRFPGEHRIPNPSTDNRVFVGNLDPNEANDDAVRLLFEPFGPLRHSRVIRRAQDDKPRGYAFVDFLNRDDAQKAIEAMDRTYIGQRIIRCIRASPPRETVRPRHKLPPRPPSPTRRDNPFSARGGPRQPSSTVGYPSPETFVLPGKGRRAIPIKSPSGELLDFSSLNKPKSQE